jgi:flagellar biosynthesis chaperone FliJ
MCQLAMNPTMREVKERNVLIKEEYEDVFSLFVGALKKHKRLAKIKDFLMDYFRLYQRAYGMFRLDFNSFNKAVTMIADNSQQYFEDKNEDVDIREKRDKLMKLEAVINFLEVGARMITERTDLNYQRVSKKLSELIDKKDSDWRAISQDLLVAKVSAEAEMSTTI